MNHSEQRSALGPVKPRFLLLYFRYGFGGTACKAGALPGLGPPATLREGVPSGLAGSTNRLLRPPRAGLGSGSVSQGLWPFGAKGQEAGSAPPRQLTGTRPRGREGAGSLGGRPVQWLSRGWRSARTRAKLHRVGPAASRAPASVRGTEVLRTPDVGVQGHRFPAHACSPTAPVTPPHARTFVTRAHTHRTETEADTKSDHAQSHASSENTHHGNPGPRTHSRT